jgi:intron-binding protein aquarius
LEVETFVPLLLQRSSTRLQRVTLIGDHRQLPPVVKSAALRRFAHFDQSLFERLVRLGVPHVLLDQQVSRINGVCAIVNG